MKSEKLLPLFKHYMTNSYSGDTHFIYNSSFECQVISAVPNFIISDGYHKVPCEITKEAIISMKQYYPSIKIRDLVGCCIILLEYCPHTILSNKIRPILHIYDFLLASPELQKNVSIIGKPKEFSTGKENTQEMVNILKFETIKHLRRHLLSRQSVDKVPPLEDILMDKNSSSKRIERTIPYEEKKCPKIEDSGRVIYTSGALERMEEKLTEKAGRELIETKEYLRRQREMARKIFRERKEKPKSLEKDLTDWARDLKSEKIDKEGIVKEGVARIIAKGENKQLNAIGMRSVSKLSVTSKRGNESEVKYDARGFKRFMEWRQSTNNHSSESNDVINVLKRNSSGSIRVDFSAPSKPQKAFDGWLSNLAGKRRNSPEGAASCKKSTAKKPKL